MKLARRAFLRAGAGALFSASAPGIATAVASPAILRGNAARRISLQNIHTGEHLATEYFADGRYMPGALDAINRLLRDFRTGDVHAMDPRLLDLLNSLSVRMDTTAQFHVISGFRSPHTNGMLHGKSSGVATKSLHMQGMAIDVRLPGRPLNNLHAAAVSLEQGGVGFYPSSDFVHVDTGRVRRWSGV
ncbi:MAG: hypothetical protein RL274_2070 [Pseudomonadota bacterium]|jgi:uncharacterized protein YcbK (DUF882 family)